LREQVDLARRRNGVLARPTLGSAFGLTASMLLIGLSFDAHAQGMEPQPGEVPRRALVPDERPASLADAENLSPPYAAKSVEVELAGEVAYVTPPIRGGATPFGAGFGARVGLDLSGFYLGVSVLDFLGGKDVDVTYRALLYGVEFGYGLRLPAFGGAFWLVRPRLGVGNAAVYYTDPSLAVDVVTSASGSSSASNTLTVNNVFVQPGVTVELASGGHFAAIDASALVLPGIAYGGADATTWISYGAQLQLGFRF
jgi:hypothetical protein